MKRFGLLLTLLLIIVAVLTPSALAASTQWTLAWQYNGSLNESLLIPSRQLAETPGLQDLLTVKGWKKAKEGDSTLFTRNYDSWKQYKAAGDSLPLSASKVDYIVFTMVEINPAPGEVSANEILKVLDKNGDVDVIITMPDTIKQSSGTMVDDDSIRFSIDSLTDPQFTAKTLVYSSWFQWFEMGIAVLILGTMAIMIYLMLRMRNVDRLIEEEYSLQRVEEMILGEGENQEKEENETDKG